MFFKSLNLSYLLLIGNTSRSAFTTVDPGDITDDLDLTHPRFNLNYYIVSSNGPYQLFDTDLRDFQGNVGMLTDRV